MRAPGGRLIPLVAAIGNHDRSDEGGDDPAEVARFFSGFLYQDPGGRSYFTRRFGPRVAVFVLDSGHLARQAGAQADWLEAQLRATQGLPVRFALYHVALFPAHQPIGDSVRVERASWLPLFDAFHLTAAFEHHGHLHKRTLPLRAGVPVTDGTGIVYFGDGDWGKSHSKEPIRDREYLAAATSQRHFWQVTVSEDGVRYQAIDGFGRVFDRAAQDARGAWLPEAAP
jgi:hypothetical protein